MSANEVFTLPNHYNIIRNEFKKMCSNGDYADVTLWCEKRPIRAHKCMLAAASDYFRMIFKDLSQQQQPQSHSVILFQNMRHDDLLAVILYIYDGHLAVPAQHRSSFVEVARTLGVDIGQVRPFVEQELDSGIHSGGATSPEPIALMQQTVNIETVAGEKVKVHNKSTGDRRSDVLVVSQRQCNRILPPKSKVNQKFDTQVICVLRDMRIDTVDIFAEKLLKLDNIYQLDRAQIVIYHTVDRATHFVRFATVYLKLCKQLIEKEPEYIDAASESSFRKLLLNHCHQMFTELVLTEKDVDCTKQRKRCLGLVRFIGLMYLHKLLYANILEWIIGALLEFPTQGRLECLYELLGVVGEHIEIRSGDAETDMQWYRDMSKYYDTLKAILDDEGHEMKIDARIRYRDLLKCRANGWAKPVQLILGDYGPMVNQRRKMTPSLVSASPTPTIVRANNDLNGDIESKHSVEFHEIEDKHDGLSNSGTVRSIIDSLRTFIRKRDENIAAMSPPSPPPTKMSDLDGSLKDRHLAEHHIKQVVKTGD